MATFDAQFSEYHHQLEECGDGPEVVMFDGMVQFHTPDGKVCETPYWNRLYKAPGGQNRTVRAFFMGSIELLPPKYWEHLAKLAQAAASARAVTSARPVTSAALGRSKLAERDDDWPHSHENHAHTKPHRRRARWGAGGPRRKETGQDMTNTRSVLGVALIVLFGISLGVKAGAQEPAPANPYSGDFWTRSTLTGDWGGVRNDLAAKGATFDATLTQITQGVVSGGKDDLWKYGGRGNLTTNVDTQKLGLWPGGFFMMEIEGKFGESVSSQTGALMPVNINQIIPMANKNDLDIPALSFTQFLSEYFGVYAGKIDTFAGDMNEFAHGKGDVQFINTALSVTPVSLLSVPYSTLGAGLIILPTKDIHGAIISLSAFNTNGLADSAGFDTLSSTHTTYVPEVRVRTNFFGLTGHHLAGYIYSSKEFTSLDQSLRFIIQNGSIEKKSGTWAFYYNFDQYLYEKKKGSGQGIGIFGRFGASDGNPNPVHYFYSLGIGGKGVIPGRPLDQFGIGYYYIDVRNPSFTALQARSFLRNEQGFEAYYNMALTPWMKLTPDIQVVRPAQKQVISVGQVLGGQNSTVANNDINTAIVLGLRLQLIF